MYFYGYLKTIFFFQVEKVNIFDETTLSGPLSDCDAIISCLGVKPSFRNSTTIYSESIKPIVEAMKHVEVRKLVVASSWYTVGKSLHWVSHQCGLVITVGKLLLWVSH